ncbi:hypothetical protein BSKO_03263 [Bryopsis sp. KO-2023]|nr:hypothetical protein BSKO_03263 [Bryopsis sp. KO-2023]
MSQLYNSLGGSPPELYAEMHHASGASSPKARDKAERTVVLPPARQDSASVETLSSSLDSRSSDPPSSMDSTSDPQFRLELEGARSKKCREGQIPPQLKDWSIFERLQGLAREPPKGPFRICVKGLGDSIRQKIRTTALLAGFDHVHETKEKNMWVGRLADSSGGPSNPVIGKANGEAGKENRTVNKVTEGELRELMDMSLSQFSTVEAHVCDAIRSYLGVWMKDVSKTFERSETCCTSLETDCFLKDKEWVQRQAITIAPQFALMAVPTPGGHLKIQKPTSPGQSEIVQGSAGEAPKSQPVVAAFQKNHVGHQSSAAGGSSGGSRLANILVVKRLQDCYSTRQREYTFILEISRSDIRIKLTNLAKAVGFSSVKITTKGKLVVMKEDSGSIISEASARALAQFRPDQLREIDTHVQRGVRSHILTWFAAFEKSSIARKTLSTNTFLMPNDWVKEHAESVAASIGIVTEVKQCGVLEIARQPQIACGPRVLPITSLNNTTNSIEPPPRSERSGGTVNRPAFKPSVLVVQQKGKAVNSLVVETLGQSSPPLTPDQVAVWNQLKSLYKSKQGVHLIWAEGLDAGTKRTICDAALKLGFSSTQDLGSYIRLSRFDAQASGGSSSQAVSGCKLGKLADNLRNNVVNLDNAVIPAVETCINQQLWDFKIGNENETNLEVGSYPLPQFKVARVVEDMAKRLGLHTTKKPNSRTILVSKTSPTLATVSSPVMAQIQPVAAVSTPVHTAGISQTLPPSPGCSGQYGWSMAFPTQLVFGSAPQSGVSASALNACGLMSPVPVPGPPATPRDEGGLSDEFFRLLTKDFTEPDTASLTNSMDGVRALHLKSPRSPGVQLGCPQSSSLMLPSPIQLADPPLLPLAQPGSLRLPFEHPNTLDAGAISLGSAGALESIIAALSKPVTCAVSVGRMVAPEKREADLPMPYSGGSELFARPFAMNPHGMLDELPLDAAVHYVTTKEHMDFWCNLITKSGVSVMGIDTEWKPNFKEGDNHPVALIQMCFRVDPTAASYICVLFHVHHSSFTAPFVALLESYTIAKVGVQIDADIDKVRRDHSVEMNNCVELYSEAWNRQGIEARGLKGLVAAVLDRDLPKNKSVTLSDWEQTPLTTSQERYAAYDAYAALRIYEALRGID